MEKRTTFTPSALATRKWPSSWTKMSPPSRRTMEPTLRSSSEAMSGFLSALLGPAPAPVAGGHRLVDGAERLRPVGLQHLAADPGDVVEAAPPLQERRHRRLVRAGQRRRGGAPHLQCPVGEGVGGEAHRV